jgi:hypothetical protein
VSSGHVCRVTVTDGTEVYGADLFDDCRVEVLRKHKNHWLVLDAGRLTGQLITHIESRHAPPLRVLRVLGTALASCIANGIEARS